MPSSQSRIMMRFSAATDSWACRADWICQRCLQGAPSAVQPRRPLHVRRARPAASQRTFSATARLHDATTPPTDPSNDLPSSAERRRSALSKRFSHLMDGVQANVFLASQRLNDLTGYSGIEALKRSIEEQENHARATKAALAAAKQAYDAAIAQRSASQREVNELLQRKHAWAPADLERFTALYRSDHVNEQAEGEARAEVDKRERAADEAAAGLGRSILARYHEEQIWSDKIRRMSTWGTWGLMGVNVLLFVVFQVAVEPWRRRRLVQGFEEKVMDALERERGPSIATSEGRSSSVQDTPATGDGDLPAASGIDIAAVVDPEAPERPAMIEHTAHREEKRLETQNIRGWREVPYYYKSRLQDLFSDRAVTVKQSDLTKAGLEGAFVGLTAAGLVVAFIRGR